MSSSLVISVRLHEGWYHGAGSIPSPARLFQALVAGPGLSGPLPAESIAALEWLEQQPPPIVAAPVTKSGQPIATYVPNNDLDAKQGDHRRIGEIRTKKSIRPLLFEADVPFVYCWTLNNENRDDVAIRHICELADRVYQLGRTVDAAWAWGEVLSDDELREMLRSHPGPVRHPAVGRGNVESPNPGSLDSLMRRHADMSKRYGLTSDGKGQTFRRRSKPKWRMVSYESASTRVSFDLIDRETSTLAAWPTVKTMALVTTVRDMAVSNLTRTLPEREAEIHRTLIGRKANGEHAGPTSARVRITPLPSIGHAMTSQEIRRILIEIPGDCPLRADDVIWAFSGQTLSLHGRTVDLVRSQTHRQLEYYGVTARASRHWQTVTPAALSSTVRRRMEPDPRKRQPSDLKGAGEKRFEQELAASAIRQALRHTGVRATAREIRVQREPFTSRGQKAEHFDVSPRFSHHALWHVSLELDETVSGPMCLGDGRFLGLGVMRPVTPAPHALAFQITSGLTEHSKPLELAGAFRRAVMARVRDETGFTELDTYFTGHNRDGSPAQRETQPHVSYLFDPTTNRLLIIPPVNRNADLSATFADRHRDLEAAVEDLHTLRAGTCGKVRLRPVTIDEVTDHLFTFSKCWTTVTPYTVNRHAKKTTAESIIRRDILAECERRGLPRPEITVQDWTAHSGTGLQGQIRLTFQQTIQGPIILGRTRHIGGGVFSAVDRRSASR